MHRFLPPPVILVLTALAMWLLSRLAPATTVSIPAAQWLALLVAMVALVIMALAAWEFRRHRTTINPMRPEDSSALVNTGLFRYSRNPIYLADALLLAAWGVYLGNIAAALLIPVFIWLIHHFQIRPEERALEAHFGEAYREYTRAVRRWI